MSAADGSISAPSAASCALEAFSRASNARWIAPAINGFAIRSSASFPSVSSPCFVSRSRSPSASSSSLIRRAFLLVGGAERRLAQSASLAGARVRETSAEPG